MVEIWKDIKGYETIYQASNMGRVKTLPRLKNGRYGQYMTKEKIMKPFKTEDGYLKIKLNGKNHYIHRLVAEAFLPNPDNLPVINHKDFNPSNNTTSNLEWCSQKYNIKYNVKNKHHRYSCSSILQKTLFGDIIKEWDNYMEINNTLGYSISAISKCVCGVHKQAYGYLWERVA